MCDNYYTQIEDLMRDYTITVKNGYMWAEPKSEEEVSNMCDNYYEKWMQKDTGMMIMLPKTLYGKDLCIAERIKHEYGFISTDPTLKPVEVDIDIRRTKSESSLTIDGGNITTDSVALYKLVEFCGSNNIKLSIIDGHINLNV